MTLKPIKGTFERVIIKEYCDNFPDLPHTYSQVPSRQTQEARIYAEHFAVYKRDERASDWQWELYHAPTGCPLTACGRLKDCVAVIKALLEIDLPWEEPDRENWETLNKERPHLHTAFRDALEVKAPAGPSRGHIRKVPAAYGTLASAMENHNSYCPYAQAYKSLWEQDPFHIITIATIRERIRFEIAEELIDAAYSAQEAYDDIMNYPCNGVYCLRMGTPLNGRAQRAIMHWAKAHGMIQPTATGGNETGKVAKNIAAHNVQLDS